MIQSLHSRVRAAVQPSNTSSLQQSGARVSKASSGSSPGLHTARGSTAADIHQLRRALRLALPALIDRNFGIPCRGRAIGCRLCIPFCASRPHHRLRWYWLSAFVTHPPREGVYE